MAKVAVAAADVAVAMVTVMVAVAVAKLCARNPRTCPRPSYLPHPTAVHDTG